MLMIDQTRALYTREEAERIARVMNETDDWHYVAKHDPAGTGGSFIEVYDEADEFVAYMTAHRRTKNA